jgi:DegV family protein with EDD domain
MAKIAILTDSTAYLTKEYLKKHDVRVIPLNLHWGDDLYKDNVDITADEFYTRLKTSPTLPTTSQPTYGEFEVIFKEFGEKYDASIAVLLSSGISGTVDSALMAQKILKDVPIEVVDTKTAAGGLALIVNAVVDAVEGGKSAKQAADLARTIADATGTYFVVDTLKYLHKGGRIGGASRYFGTALDIKPILYLNAEGKIDALEKVRTKKKAVNRLIELVKEKADGKKCHLSIYHAQAAKEAEKMRDTIKETMDCHDIEIYTLSPVIGAHVGEGTLGISVHTIEY